MSRKTAPRIRIGQELEAALKPPGQGGFGRISEPPPVPAMSVCERDEVAYMFDLDLHPATVAHKKFLGIPS